MSDYLSKLNSFERAIDRGIGHFRSSELDGSVRAINTYIKKPNAPNITAVRNWLAGWKSRNPKEYANRGAPIENDLRAELNQHLDKWGVPKAPTDAPPTGPGPAWTASNVRAWVESRRAALEKFGAYACGDLKHGQPKTGGTGEPDWNNGFARIANPAKRKEIWDRYRDAKNYPGVGAQSGILIGRQWKAMQFSGIYQAVTTGKRGVCTTFAQAAAHVLTSALPHGPRVEVVSWGGGGAGHVFVLVNRAGGYLGDKVPDAWVNEADIVIVDPWRASLGWQTISYGKSQYRSGMVNGLACVGEKPAW